MKRQFTLFCCLYLLGGIALHGQDFSIRGQVSSSDSVAISAAKVLLQVDGQSPIGIFTDGKGAFVLSGLNPAMYMLRIEMQGFEPYRRPVSIISKDRDLGLIFLQEQAYAAEEVVIEGQGAPAIQKGDTTQFNAGAYKTNPDANAENLIEKMPGITVDNGSVSAQGEKVQKVLVDGREFFGNDPTAALRNLPAEVISQIQVFDQQSEQSQLTGVDDGETVKTINIVTKVNMRNGTFGTQYAGAGYGDGQEDELRYQAGGSLNFFQDDRRLSVLAQSNNINKQNFSSEDLLGVVSASGSSGRGRRGGGGRGDSGGGGGSRGGSSASEFLVGEQGGISNTHSLGVNYSDKVGEKFEVEGSYFFNRSDNVSDQSIYQQYLTDSDTGQVYQENELATTANMNHRLSMRLSFKPNEKNSFIIRPRVSLQMNDGETTTFGTTSLGKGLLNESNNAFQANLLGVNASNMILYRHRFEKRGRSLSARLNTTYTENSGDNLLQSFLGYYDPNVLLDSLNQFSTLLSNGWNFSGNVQYTEPISKQATLSFTYTASPEFNQSDKLTNNFSRERQDYTILDTLLSNTFENTYMAHRVGAGLMLRMGKAFLVSRLEVQQANLNSQSQFPRVDSTTFSFQNLLPFVMYRYRFEKQGDLRIIYRGRTNPPSISQLQNVIDNSNPLQLSTGNPDLKQDYQHFFMMRFNATKTEKNRVLMGYLSGQFTENYIATSSLTPRRDTMIFDYLVPGGTQLSQPVNLDGYWNVRSLLTYGRLLEQARLNVNLNLSADYNRRPGLINGEANFSNTATFGLGVVLSSNISEKVDFTLSSRSSLSDVTNSVLVFQNTQYFNQTSKLRLNLILGKGIVFRSEVNHQMYRGLSEDFNTDFWLWNASIGKKLFKNQRGEIQLSVFDLLKQNTNIQRTVSELYIEDVQTAVLQRYLMLTFTYQLRNFKTES